MKGVLEEHSGFIEVRRKDNRTWRLACHPYVLPLSYHEHHAYIPIKHIYRGWAVRINSTSTTFQASKLAHRETIETWVEWAFQTIFLQLKQNTLVDLDILPQQACFAPKLADFNRTPAQDPVAFATLRSCIKKTSAYLVLDKVDAVHTCLPLPSEQVDASGCTSRNTTCNKMETYLQEEDRKKRVLW